MKGRRSRWTQGLGTWSEGDRDTDGQELADVSIYLLRLADVCGVKVGREAMTATAGGAGRRGGGRILAVQSMAGTVWLATYPQHFATYKAMGLNILGQVGGLCVCIKH